MPVEFHPLPVTVRPETTDSVSISFEVLPEMRESFRHTPGQYLILRHEIGGADVRRSYSICSSANDPELRVGIKAVPNGVFSTFAINELSTGDTLEVMGPVGEFVHDVVPDAANEYVALAAGSGITPILSIVTTVLESEQASRFTLIYGNKTTQSIMFLEELEGLKNRFPDRFQLVHVLSREPHEIPLFEGRIDEAKLRMLTSTLIDAGQVSRWYVCGPLDMVETVEATLGSLGVAESVIVKELFFDQRIESIPEVSDDEGLVDMIVTLDGRSSRVKVDPEGPSILDYARSVRAEVPFACKGGMCATCKGQITEGEVTMEKNYALTPEEIEAGFVLTCQAHPVSETLTLTFDVHGGTGR